MSETNGAVQQATGPPEGENRIADILEEEVSLGYRPTLPLEQMWLSGTGDMPQITLRRDIEFMQYHPTVCAGLEYYKSGIAGAEFWGGPKHDQPDDEVGRPISPDPKVAQFVLQLCERFWQRGMPMMQEGGYPHGWGAGEHVYKEVGGMLVWSHMKDFHPTDAYILTYLHQPIGLRIKRVYESPGEHLAGPNDPTGRRAGEVDLWFASGHIPAKAAWYPHRPRFNQFYGRSQLIGCWRPWRRLGFRDGLEQIIDAALYRAGYSGPVVKHPPGDTAAVNKTGIPATQADGGGQMRRNNRDVARQIVEWMKAGAGITVSSEQYPQAQGGGPKWDVEFPTHVMDVGPLLKAAEYMENQIFLGIGVPPELIRAGGTGSGYSGRSIPREAFLDQQQRVADHLLQLFVEQVIKPLVMWNFGDVPFNVQVKSLLKSQADDKQGQQQGQGKPGGGQPPGPPASPPQPNPSQPFSHLVSARSMDNPSYRDRVLDVVRRVLKSGKLDRRQP